ncbi:class I SAM-dependent methyltransferase [Catellatospora paridis]|uniref:class I SAM-dependent methyltransferase n=1 Tax=Catellatospora paridis TaxID=1617086 RepID=UPI0012D3F4AF|nr:class I SAM-dependent methyltransferase [Catellatospora paridis]
MTHTSAPPPEGEPRHDFDAMYADTPPWEIGRPQPALAAVAAAGGLHGRVLDVGCGTGEHALMAAAAGLPATGIDAAPTAIGLARAKAAARGLAATFIVDDVMHLAEHGRWDTVLDSALFHTLSDADRVTYGQVVLTAVVPGGTYHLLCFSEREPGDWGPRRVTQAEIRAVFDQGWTVERIEPAVLEMSSVKDTAQGWLATIRRTDVN